MKRLLVLLLALASGCGSAYGGVEIYVIGGDIEAAASPSFIQLREGGVVVVDARPLAADSHSEYEGLERFELRVADTRIAAVRRGILKDAWVISGTSPGDTQVQVRIDGELEQLIPLRVNP